MTHPVVISYLKMPLLLEQPDILHIYIYIYIILIFSCFDCIQAFVKNESAAFNSNEVKSTDRLSENISILNLLSLATWAACYDFS